MSRGLRKRKESPTSHVWFQKRAFRAWVLRGEKRRAFLGAEKSDSEGKLAGQSCHSSTPQTENSRYQLLTRHGATSNAGTKGGRITKVAF